MPGTGLITWAMDYRVDRVRKDVTVTLLGLGRSHAVYRGELGCFLDHGDAIADIAPPPIDKPQPPLLPDIAGPSVVPPQSPQLAAALDRAFAEPDAAALQRTRAIVVVKDGRIIAERYADGYRHRHAAARLLHDEVGDLSADRHSRAPGQVEARPARAGCGVANPDDPRHAITVDQLLRHTAGLELGSSLQASLGAAFEPVNRMKFMEADMAAFAESMPLATAPGSAVELSRRQHLILVASDPQRRRRQAVGRAALRAPGIVRPARHAPRHARVRRRRHVRRDRARCWPPRATGRASAALSQ